MPPLSKRTLVAVIGAALAVVAALAVLTPTVIVSDDGSGGRVVQLAPLPAPGRGLPPPRRGREGRRLEPGFGPLRDLRGCLEKHGLGRPNRSAPPDLKTMRDALKACRGTMPGPRFGR